MADRSCVKHIFTWASVKECFTCEADRSGRPAKTVSALFGHLITVVLVPSTSHLLAFAVTALVIIVVPGPSVLFVFGRALGLGRTAGVATVAGNTIGEYVQVLAVAFGIGALVERSVLAFTVLKLAGAAYLVYLGVQAIRHRRSLVATLAAPMERKTAWRIALDGFFV